MKSISLVDSSFPGATINVNEGKYQYTFEYPCESNTQCTDYEVTLAPGLYRFENNTCISNSVVRKYNGNTVCYQMSSIGGAGGYILSLIHI